MLGDINLVSVTNMDIHDSEVFVGSGPMEMNIEHIRIFGAYLMAEVVVKIPM
jgi:hypothetical protein